MMETIQSWDRRGKKEEIVMETVWIVAKQIAIMFALIAIGWILFRMKLLSELGAKDLSNLLLRIVVPAIVLKSFIVERTPENTQAFLISFLLSFGLIVMSAAVAKLVFRDKRPAEQFGAAFANAGFFGIALVSALLGESAVFHITSFVMMIFVFQWTYGVHLFTRDRSIFAPKRLLTNPVLIAFVLAVILFFTQLPVPEFVMTPLSMITPLNTPIAMIVIGSYLARDRFLDLLRDPGTYAVAAFRLVVIPLLSLLVLSLLPAAWGELRLALLLPAAAPVGVNVVLFAGLYDKDYRKAVRIVCVSTVLSIVTIPLLFALATALWP